MTIVFTDHGQDFLEWDLDAEGKVIACRPFQEWAWKGYLVRDAAGLKAGDTVHILTKNGLETFINYPVLEVRS